MLEQVILVDKNNNEIGTEEKLKAHQLGLLHRAFSIFILRNNQDLELLMQKRVLEKYHSGGLWANSCCGHPRPFESLMEAANRRLYEEIELTLPLKEIGTFIYKTHVGRNLIEHELDHVLIGYYENQSMVPNPVEVETLQWYKIYEVIKAMDKTPSLFAVWLKEALKMVINFTKIEDDQLLQLKLLAVDQQDDPAKSLSKHNP